MKNLMDDFWARLNVQLRSFAEYLLVAHPALAFQVGHTANSAFLLRGYLEFYCGSDGNEVAVTIDVQTDGQQLSIKTDICSNAGKIIATGPSAKIKLGIDEQSTSNRLSDWLADFQRFLFQNEKQIAAAVYAAV